MKGYAADITDCDCDGCARGIGYAIAEAFFGKGPCDHRRSG